MIQLLLCVIYPACISLGLPSGILGAAWPSMYPGLGVSVSSAGILSMLMSLGSLCGNLTNHPLTRRCGPGTGAALRVAVTASGLFAFSFSRSFALLCLLAVPYGLGTGNLDATLNKYVALNYPSRYVSWLHCMWGLGAAVGPYVMGQVLTGGGHWSGGYRLVGSVQLAVVLLLVLSVPRWRAVAGKRAAMPQLRTILIPGAPEVMVALFCYNALEVTTSLWISSYLTLHRGLAAQDAARFSSIFFLGLTLGRGINGFLTIRFSDAQLVRLGQGTILAGISVLLLAPGLSMAGLVLVGLGCAPIYPCILHGTPGWFGADRAQVLMGIQMAGSSAGAIVMPPVFGFLADRAGVAWLPAYLLGILGVMVVMHERLLARSRAGML